MKEEYEKALKYFNNEVHYDSKGYYQKIKTGSALKTTRDLLITWIALPIMGLLFDMLVPWDTTGAGLELMLICSAFISFCILLREASGGVSEKNYYTQFDLDKLLLRYKEAKL
jgi:hypothetical protein